MPRIEASELIKGRPWPILEVRLEIAGKGETHFYAMVDSGADTSIVPFEVVEPSGLKWGDLKPAPQGKGVGGQVQQRLLKGRLLWRGQVICSPVRIGQAGKFQIALLGRDDFFKLYVVRFNWHQKPPTFDVDPIGGKGSRRKRR